MSAEIGAGVQISRPISPREQQHYGTIVVVGGGCYGSYYVRQLRRAVAAGAITVEHLVVVDRDAACRVALEACPEAERVVPEIVVAEWSAFFAEYFSRALGTPSDTDAIVPSPLMPHLMFEWLLARARDRWPGRAVGTRPLGAAPAVPWQAPGANDVHYVSFAEWMCPINCIEPAKCPETRGPRSWSMPVAVREFVEAETRRGRVLAGPVIFHCSHRAYGVGMFDTRDVLAADRLVAQVGAAGPADVLVGTVSHCHGALSILAVGE